jgi:hypothetical protein
LKYALLLLLLLGTVLPLNADELVLNWEWPVDFTPAPTSFLVSYRSSQAPLTVSQFRLPNQGRASCLGVQTAVQLTPDSVCGRPPDCLPPAIYVFTVQAEVGEQRSPESPPATCEAKPHCLYNCQGVGLPPALQDLANAAPPGRPPSAQEVADVLASLARQPITPPLPSVTAPAPTTDDIRDTVEAALNQLPRNPV